MLQDRDAAGGPGPGTGPDSGEPGPDSGDESLADAFWAVARQLRETTQETLAPWEITPAQLRALRVLRRHGAVRLSELSGRLHIAARSTTEVIDALESRGLVARRPDPDDRRAILVEVTDHGSSTLEAIGTARGTEVERAFDRLTPADRADLARILRKLRR